MKICRLFKFKDYLINVFNQVIETIDKWKNKLVNEFGFPVSNSHYHSNTFLFPKDNSEEYLFFRCIFFKKWPLHRMSLNFIFLEYLFYPVICGYHGFAIRNSLYGRIYGILKVLI